MSNSWSPLLWHGKTLFSHRSNRSSGMTTQPDSRALTLVKKSTANLRAQIFGTVEGPFLIKKKTGPVTYQIHMPDRKQNFNASTSKFGRNSTPSIDCNDCSSITLCQSYAGRRWASKTILVWPRAQETATLGPPVRRWEGQTPPYPSPLLDYSRTHRDCSGPHYLKGSCAVNSIPEDLLPACKKELEVMRKRYLGMTKPSSSE